MRITVSGPPGSGKTTIVKHLAEKLNYKIISAGEEFRELANQYKMSLLEFSDYAEKHPEIDIELDKQLMALAKNENNVVIDGRLSGWLTYKNNISAYRIYINAPLKIRAERIASRENKPVEVVEKEIQTREQSENSRYYRFYQIDMNSVSIYDLIVDSSNKIPEEIILEILKKLSEFRGESHWIF